MERATAPIGHLNEDVARSAVLEAHRPSLDLLSRAKLRLLLVLLAVVGAHLRELLVDSSLDLGVERISELLLRKAVVLDIAKEHLNGSEQVCVLQEVLAPMLLAIPYVFATLGAKCLR